jgi:hypothetical protein
MSDTQSALLDFYNNTKTVNLLTVLLLILVVIRVVAIGLSRLLLTAINLLALALGVYIVYHFFTETQRLCERIPELYDGSSNNKPVVTHVYMCYSLVAVFVSLLVYLAFLLIF